ncbi:TetR/AcrR family transcriptional regulator [Micromonospora sp. NBRC 101691]|uniref:TetR/AcrR family transcriptional regulator n=1 Tax=Micromonospora sp. NBRC 101691 TaxID=3032198 RepID=UPI0024A5C36E|nr:TetR/AcrR family transcriptional regulator [Micromonospora sp. NBRC 101691]GLY24543.1 TetR family transcriptional regulator [Micromonospora sp. NBRC 101691]
MSVVKPSASLRERRRAATIDEIIGVALRHLAEHGVHELSLRAVAREVGMTVQALYHYFDSRDALLTALIAHGQNTLADALRATAEAHRDAGYVDRCVAVSLTYREWALGNKPLFLLLYGNPVPGYAAPEGGPTMMAGRRVAEVFAEVVFAGWTAEQIAAVPVPADDPALTAQLTGAAQAMAPHLSPGALAQFLGAWAQLHGLVMLDLLNHLRWLEGDAATEYHRAMLVQLGNRLVALRDAT